MEPAWRSKAAFWALTLAFLALAGLPSVVLVRSLERYLRFLSGWDPGVLRPSTTRRLPHRGAHSGDVAPAVLFVEFRLKAPKAKQVLLAGDFSQWRPDVALKKAPEGVWETVLPLPPGRYHYLFQVDGAWLADPKAPLEGSYERQPTSVKEVR
ncbi:MAG: hypothetical protein HY554_07625 [Elusimicrobia bacterium]|nr:hypothetical protein [Elusimicrobiota bacterium]